MVNYIKVYLYLTAYISVCKICNICVHYISEIEVILRVQTVFYKCKLIGMALYHSLLQVVLYTNNDLGLHVYTMDTCSILCSLIHFKWL